jgi:hypothetical protein
MITPDDQKHLAALKAKMSGEGHQVYDSDDIKWLFGFVERLQATIPNIKIKCILELSAEADAKYKAIFDGLAAKYWKSFSSWLEEKANQIGATNERN